MTVLPPLNCLQGYSKPSASNSALSRYVRDDAETRLP